MKNSVTRGFTAALRRIEHFADLAKTLHHSLGELGILDEFLTVRPFRDAAKAAHPLSDVGLEPNAPLFAIIDDIDTGCHLLFQNVRDPRADGGLQSAVVDRFAGLLVDQHLTERLGRRSLVTSAACAIGAPLPDHRGW